MSILHHIVHKEKESFLLLFTDGQSKTVHIRTMTLYPKEVKVKARAKINRKKIRNLEATCSVNEDIPVERFSMYSEN